MNEFIKIISIQLYITSYEDALARIAKWVEKNESRYVCAANVHMAMEAYDSKEFEQVVNQADLITPDGMPLVWLMRLLGAPKQQRVYGPDLAIYAVALAEKKGIPVGLYGGTQKTLDSFCAVLKTRFPAIHIPYVYSPPFRELTSEEDRKIIQDINNSGARILLVGLGCPKQERWMSVHRGEIPVVMLGVGAAFEIHSGLKNQAPGWMQRIGLEWFFRLVQEPKRLWRRYLYHNPRFLMLACQQLLKRPK